jgi:hypothetical protein
MSDIQWYFKPQPKGHRDRNPIQNAFFDSEAVGSVTGALIREGLQNSGDARSDLTADTDPVRVRIFVSGDDYALDPDASGRWGRELWKHVWAEASGLRNPPKSGEPCRFLLFEDFRTTGLEGATATDEPSEEPFYCFLRAENATSKRENSGGSWGVGKTAFPRASRANAFFALSTRESDGRRLLMGSLTLRTRTVDGVKYCPDAWFGEAEPGEEHGGVIQPVEQQELLERFRRDFQLTRPLSGDLSARTGTSVVVPWCEQEVDADAIVRAVAESNFLPIVTGVIEVSVGEDPDPSNDVVLNAETIEDTVKGLGDEELLASVRLARWIRERGESERVAATHEPPQHSVKWEQYSLPDEERDRLRRRFDEGRPVSVRVPVPMRPKGKEPTRTSHLEVALQRTPQGSTVRPVFVRGSVVVPDPKIRRVPGALAIIRAENDELGNLLRAAEDPGHKEWSTDTDRFYRYKQAFVYAKSFVDLARNAAPAVQRMLQDSDLEEDLDLLGDVFALPKDSEEEPLRPGDKGGRSRTKKKKKPVPPLPRRPQLVAAQRVTGGFRIAPASKATETPDRITVRAGYDRRKGDPIRKWDPADFEFGRHPLTMELSGLEIEDASENRISVRVKDPDFELTVTGFEPSRGDVVVRVRPEGRLNA